MKHLPRALNRCYLFILGLLLVSAGIALSALTLVPTLQQRWNHFGQIAWDRYNSFSHSYRIIPDISVAQIIWFIVLLFLIVVLLDWIFRQGGGKTNKVASLNSKSREGSVTAELSFVDDILQKTLGDDRMITSLSTSAWRVKRTTGIKIKIVAAKGANIGQIRESVSAAVTKMDAIFGSTVPVLVHITDGWLMKTPSRTN